MWCGNRNSRSLRFGEEEGNRQSRSWPRLALHHGAENASEMTQMPHEPARKGTLRGQKGHGRKRHTGTRQKCAVDGTRCGQGDFRKCERTSPALVSAKRDCGRGLDSRSNGWRIVSRSWEVTSTEPASAKLKSAFPAQCPLLSGQGNRIGKQRLDLPFFSFQRDQPVLSRTWVAL